MKSLLSLCLFLASTLLRAKTLTDADGRLVIVPDRPLRVIVLSEIDLDSALALGLTPLATVSGRGQHGLPHYLLANSAAAKMEIIGELGRPKLERIASLHPELILTGPNRPELTALLAKIAPTYTTFKHGDLWQDVLQRVAAALGREVEAAQFQERYASELAKAKNGLSAWQGKTMSILRWNPKGPAFMQNDAFASLIIRDLGLLRPQAQRVPGQKHSLPVSLEALPLIDADWIFIGTLSPTGDAAAALKSVQETPSFQRLGAVQGQRLRIVDGSKWTSIGGPLAALSVIADVSAQLSLKAKLR